MLAGLLLGVSVCCYYTVLICYLEVSVWVGRSCLLVVYDLGLLRSRLLRFWFRFVCLLCCVSRSVAVYLCVVVCWWFRLFGLGWVFVGGFVWLLPVSGVCGWIVCCCLGLLLLLIVILLGCRCWGYLRSCFPVYGLVLCVLRFMGFCCVGCLWLVAAGCGCLFTRCFVC